MLSIAQFRTRIIIPALDLLKLNSQAVQELLLGTALQESGLHYLTQIGGGPAKGVFQMEPATHDDIWLNYLSYRPKLVSRIEVISNHRTPNEMVGNLWYAAAMCRIHYLRVPKPLPEAGAINAQAAYWKKHYNTSKGRGTATEYIEKWNKHAA